MAHDLRCTEQIRMLGEAHLKMGESMAQLSAQPRQTTSVALSVRLGSFLKKSRMVVSSAGTREDPPTTSTDAMSSREIFASSSAWAQIPSSESLVLP